MKNIVYFNGQFMPYEKATIPLATHAFHYGTGCFEGIRGYWNEKEKKLHVFRLKDHYRRLARSCKTLSMKLPLAVDDLCQITIELLKRNRYQEGVYIRPIVYKSTEIMTAFSLRKLDDGLAIYATPLGHHFNVSAGIKVITSSWLRADARMIPPQAKPTGLYLNTCLAKTEADDRGADEAILLNSDGSVSEGSAENIFIVKKGAIATPASSENILVGVTRDTIIKLASKELGIEVEERKIRKNELFKAEEIFLTGTGAEVISVVEVDGEKVGQGRIGNITAKLQKLYFEIVHGENKEYQTWLTPV